MIQQSLFWEYLSKGKKIIIPKRYLYSQVCRNIIYNSQGMETS